MSESRESCPVDASTAASSASGGRQRMLPLLRLFLGTIVLSCLAAPWVHELVLRLWSAPQPPFRRVFDRVILLAVLLLVWRERRELPFGLVRRELAREPWRMRLRQSGLGLLATALCSALAAPWILAHPDVERSGMSALALLQRSAKDLPGALLVGGLEECFFRGIVLLALLSRLRPRLAVPSSAALYAALHFLRPDRDFTYAFGPCEGFRYFGAIVARSFSLEDTRALLGLFLAGCVLALTYCRRRSLWACIGLHAGWFLTLKLCIRGLVVHVEGGGILLDKRWFLLAHPGTWASILCAGAIVWLWPRRREPSPTHEHAPPSA